MHRPVVCSDGVNVWSRRAQGTAKLDDCALEKTYTGRVRDFQFPRDTGVAIATLLPIGVGALLVPLRDDLVSTNLALILVIFVVLGGVGAGRLGGALAAITAALSFDFFLTKPYLSLHIDIGRRLRNDAAPPRRRFHRRTDRGPVAAAPADAPSADVRRSIS